MQFCRDKAKKIRLAIFDVDGVLTNGKLVYNEAGVEYKSFHAHDGLGLKLLQKSGIAVAVITARQSEIVTKRMQELGITHVYQGQSDKIPAYEELKAKLNLSDEEIAYTGDDLTDLPLIRRAGLGITVANARSLIHQYADWVTHTEGGHGAVREICEAIMQAQGTFDTLLEHYLTR